MSDTLSFDQRAAKIKSVIVANKGGMPMEDKQRTQLSKDIMRDMKELVQSLDSMRAGSNDHRPVDISFADYVNKRYGFAKDDHTGTVESFFRGIGIAPSKTTVQQLMSMPELNENYRWLVAEILREAIRLGMRKSPLYTNLIAGNENVTQPKVSMPSINPSDATPTKIGEAETIPTGTLSFNQKDIRLQKVGIGLKITDEVQRYASLNMLTLFMSDMGVQLNMAQDVMAIDVLINGDGNSNASAVIGVETTGTMAYKDLLRAWIRMGILGRMPKSLLSNENIALEVLMLDQFTKRDIYPAATPEALAGRIINVRTPIPTNQAYDIHGAMPATNQLMLIDSSAALMKFTSDALRMDNNRIVEKQIEAAYATTTIGFACLFRDARLIIDKSLAFSSNGFPTWMDGGAVQAATVFK